MSEFLASESAGELSEFEQAKQAVSSAIKLITAEERSILNGIKQEIEAAAQGPGGAFDKKLEFCYSVKFSKDKLPNEALQKAVDRYIKAAEKRQ